ncbi:MAG: hypothetical protein IT385_06350 [Deltaproteobacteria bacterium]|nr:hypothetical protein [Deltaproteobacteria bacterium]
MRGLETSVGRPVRGPNFFDREQEQRLLWQHLRESHVLMLAPRRVGKTSLLLRLMDAAPEHGFRAISVSVADARGEDDVARKIVAALSAHPEAERAWKRVKGPLRSFFGKGGLKAKLEAGPLSLELGGQTWPTVVETAAEALEDLGERWLVLVDELPIFVLGLVREDPSGQRARAFLNWLRVLRNPVAPAGAKRPVALRWVVAGSIGLDAVVARQNLGDTINDLALFPLGPFSPVAADAFLSALAASYGLALDEPTRARLLERAGWLIPFYLQILFTRLHDLVAETGVTPSTAIVDRVVEELLTPAYRAYFDYWRQRLTEELGRPDDQRALALLAAVAQAPDGVADRPALDAALAALVPEARARDEALRFLLDVLENDGYLARITGADARQAAAPRFTFRSALLREYWLRRIV